MEKYPPVNPPLPLRAEGHAHTQPTARTPERFIEKAALYEDLLRAVSVPGWKLGEISRNFRAGATIYGFFRYEGPTQRPIKEVKVRLSDHAGNWSGYDLDLRNPNAKSMEAVVRCLQARAR